VWRDAVPIVGDGDDCSRADTADDNLDVWVFVAVFTGIFEQFVDFRECFRRHRFDGLVGLFVDTLDLGDDDVHTVPEIVAQNAVQKAAVRA